MNATGQVGSDRYLNRELSWLAFNQRVLEEASDPATPLLERVKFAAIVASNLDEFFMVRVAGLRHAVAEGDATPDLAGLSPAEQLTAVGQRAHAMVQTLYGLIADELLPALAVSGIRILRWADLDEGRRGTLGEFFRETIFPVLTPLAIDESRPFPMLSSLSLNLALRLKVSGEGPEKRLAIVQVPSGLTRLVPLHEPGQFVLLEDIVSANVALLFPGQSILESAVVRLTRDAELELDDEGGRTQLEIVERELRRRRHSGVIRLEASAGISAELIDLLRAPLDVRSDDVYIVPGPLDPRVLTGVADVPGHAALRDEPYNPADVLTNIPQADLFSLVEDEPVLLHHPYDAYDPVIALVSQAADDPDVLAIKQTLYRTSVGSPFIAILQRAAEHNKQVTVLVELTARFDEERNIHWARALEEAGAHVIYGVRGYKTHAKICLIVRKSAQGLKRYVHIGTGNYNERTARLYTDFSLITAAPSIAEDAAAVFNALTGYSDPPRLKKLVMAPTGLRARLLKLIERERRRAEDGQRAEIVAKMNSLIDGELIEALYRAAGAGVRIQLNVRGICALRPGVDANHNIEVVSIVDRFLEHSRIFYFLNGGEDEVYLASADWMTRNLDKRVELMCPVEHPPHKARALHALRAMFRDNVKARLLDPDGVYRRRRPSAGEPAFRVQAHLRDESRRRSNLSLDRAGMTLSPEDGSQRKARGVPRSTENSRPARQDPA